MTNRFFQLCAKGLLGSVLLLAPGISASQAGGKLPRGPEMAEPVAKPPAKDSSPQGGGDAASDVSPVVLKPSPPTPRPSCQDHFATALGSTGAFSPDGSLYYHASRIRRADGQKGDRRSWYRFNFHQVDMKSRAGKLLAATDLPDIDAIVPHGNPARGLTAVIWTEDAGLCHSGEGNYVTISLDASMPQKAAIEAALPKVVQDQGPVSIVDSVGSPFLYQIKRRSILELDFGKFQTRYTLLTIPDIERPLYSEPSRRMQYSWRVESNGKAEKKGLIAYLNANDPVAVLQFRGADRLIQQGKLFGVAQYIQKTNTIRIRELAKWSGGTTGADFSVTLPATHSIGEAEIKVNFPQRKMIVLGRSSAAKRIWRRIFVYDYQNGWEVAPFKPEEGSYISGADLDPTGKSVIIGLSSLESGTFQQFVVLNLATRKWLKVQLPEFR